MTPPIVAADPDGAHLQALRLRLRIPVFTATSVLLGVVAHIAGGGTPPGAAMVALMVAVVTLTSASLTRRERTLPSIVLALGLVQVGMHLALLVGHEHAASVNTDNGPAMVVSHACAVLALAWWLRRGETAAWSAAFTLWRRHVRLRSILAASNVSLRNLPAPPWRVSLARALVQVRPVRGPPALT